METGKKIYPCCCWLLGRSSGAHGLALATSYLALWCRIPWHWCRITEKWWNHRNILLRMLGAIQPMRWLRASCHLHREKNEWSPGWEVHFPPKSSSAWSVAHCDPFIWGKKCWSISVEKLSYQSCMIATVSCRSSTSSVMSIYWNHTCAHQLADNEDKLSDALPLGCQYMHPLMLWRDKAGGLVRPDETALYGQSGKVWWHS